MTQSAWLTKAKTLHKAFVIAQDSGKGNKDITMIQATTMNELQHAIGSDHGIRQVKYDEARASLDEMFTLVKGGKKTPPLAKG